MVGEMGRVGSLGRGKSTGGTKKDIRKTEPSHPTNRPRRQEGKTTAFRSEVQGKGKNIFWCWHRKRRLRLKKGGAVQNKKTGRKGGGWVATWSVNEAMHDGAIRRINASLCVRNGGSKREKEDEKWG